MTRAMGVLVGLLLAAGVAGAGDLSVQSGTGSYSSIDYTSFYAGATYYSSYLGKTPLRPEVDLGFWRAKYRETSFPYFDYAPVSNLKDVNRGVYGGVRLAVDLERIARREGNPVWPAAGIGTLVQAVSGEGSQIRMAAFARLSVGVARTSALFIELEGQTELFENGFETSTGLGAIMKAGCRIRLN